MAAVAATNTKVTNAATAKNVNMVIPGGWTPVNPKDPHVVEVGRFAVDEHNQQTGKHLKFMQVIAGMQQVVAGINYKLYIEADDGQNGENVYEAVAWEKVWEGSMQLTSFRPLLQHN